MTTPNNEDTEPSQFLSKLFTFMAERGTSISYIPIFDHRELDLYKLYKAVTARGGLAHVVESKLWRQVTCDLGVDQDRTDAGFRLRMHYLKYLYPYERRFFLNLTDDVSPTQQGAALRVQHPRTRRHGNDQQPMQQQQQQQQQPQPGAIYSAPGSTLTSPTMAPTPIAPPLSSPGVAPTPSVAAQFQPPPQQQQPQTVSSTPMMMAHPPAAVAVAPLMAASAAPGLTSPVSLPASAMASPVTLPSPISSSFEALYTAATSSSASSSSSSSMASNKEEDNPIIASPPPVVAPLSSVMELQESSATAAVMSTPPSHPIPVHAKMTPFVLHEDSATPISTAPSTPIKKLSLTVAASPVKVPNRVLGVHKESPLKFGRAVSSSTAVDFNKLDVATLLRCRHYLLQEAADGSAMDSEAEDAAAESAMTLPGSKNELCEDVAQQFGAVDVDEFTAIKSFLLRMGWRSSN